jgi:glucose-1-phosphate cytidylyltransferase
MKAVILAGGYGTRISEESGIRPKPMVEIGGKPILWHIMKIYSAHGINDFVICCGYKGHMIKEYFSNYFLHMSDITFDLKNNSMEVHRKNSEPWKVTLVDTGENVMTGGRIKRVADHINNETFCLTYGDGVSDLDITQSIAFHKEQNAKVTLTAVQQPGRFGAFTLESEDAKIGSFREKPTGDGTNNAWINGGFFVVEPAALDYIIDDDTTWEREPLEELAKEGKLAAFRHTGFWQPMDTLRDKNLLEDLWSSKTAPWKTW